MSDSEQAEAIRREMATIRCDLHDDVHDVVETARDMADWRFYVRRYPWVAAAAAAALGFLIVPPRLEVTTPDPGTLAELAKQNRLVVRPRAEGRPQGGVAAKIVGFLAKAAVRSALAYLGQQAGRLALSDPGQGEREHDR